MADERRERNGGQRIAPSSPAKKDDPDKHRSKTAGTNRDFDETGEADNQGHGHPREERDRNRE